MKRQRHPLEHAARRLRRRLTLIGLFRRVLQCLISATLLFIAFVAAERLFAVPLNLETTGAILAGAALIAAVAWGLWGRPSLSETATLADERLTLRERFSSALWALQSDDPMHRALIEDAESRVALLRPGNVFPFPFFREAGYLAGASVTAVALLLFLPPMLLVGSPGTASAVPGKPLQAEQAKQAIEQLKAIKENLDIRTELKDPLELKKIEKDLAELQKKFEMERMDSSQAVAQISRMTDRLKERRESVSKKMGAMEGLSMPQDARFTKELSKQLEMGNFDGAQKTLADLKEKMNSGQLSEQDKQKLAEELEKLALQLKDNPELAEALQKAAQNVKAGRMMEASEAMELTEAMLGDLGDLLEQMGMLEQLEAELEARKACLAGACASCEGEGGGCEGGKWATSDQLNRGWQAGEPKGFGSGMGGQPGRGMGGIAEVGQDQVAFQKERAQGDMRPGRILGQFKVAGSQTRGEANEAYAAAYIEYSQTAEDTLNREPLPLEFRALVQDYFEAIRPERAAEAESAVAPGDSP